MARIDLAPLWDFSRPAVSEQRFREAIDKADPQDALILRTQIARTYGLRKDFDLARKLLGEIEPHVGEAGAELQVRFHLELGRSYVSATHPPDLLTSTAKAKARSHYLQALEIARAARLDGLAVDAIHMLAFVDTEAEDQIKWNQAGLNVALASQDPDAQRWEAMLRNNLGYALHQQGRFEEALSQFRQALVVRERGGNAEATRVARWMIAWTLRSMGRHDEALLMQLGLEQEADEAGKPDPYVFEELEALYRSRGDEAKAEHYARRRVTTP